MQATFRPTLTIDLLRSQTFLEMSADPSLLQKQVEALPTGSRVLIDEIQRLPVLLDEVHSLMFELEDRTQFALTGSSARKLRKSHANLLAGRAVQRRMHALTSEELGKDFDIDRVLRYGSLPRTCVLPNDEERRDYLSSYVDTYLKEEIQQEAAVRNLHSYHRFLKHAALMNGQIVNLNNVSREASVARSTLDGYFSIVEETLLGSFVEPLHLRAKIKEVSSPKFYFFDCGVVRALRNELREELGDGKGYLLETFVLSELRAHSNYKQLGWEFYYWGTPSGNEVDFIIARGKQKIGLEVKSSRIWRNAFSKGLRVLLEEKKIDRAFGIYLGNNRLRDSGIDVLPLARFCELLHSGKWV